MNTPNLPQLIFTIKHYIAYRIDFVFTNEIMDILAQTEIKLSEYIHVFEALKQDPEIQMKAQGKVNYYWLNYKCYLNYLWEITTEMQHLFMGISLKSVTGTGLGKNNAFRDTLLIWKHTERIYTKYWNFNTKNTFIQQILPLISSHPEFRKILPLIDIKTYTQIAHHSFLDTLVELNVDKIDRFFSNFTNDLTLSYPQSELIEGYSNFLSQTLSGQFRLPSRSKESLYPIKFFNWAIDLMYRKEFQQALMCFNKGLKLGMINQKISTNPLVAFYHCLCIVKLKKSNSNQILSEQLKELENHSVSFLIGPRILIRQLLNLDNSDYMEFLTKHWNELSNLELTLATIITSHYQIEQLPLELIQYVEACIDSPKFKLLQLEASDALPRYIDQRKTLVEAIDSEPLLEPYIKRHPWENALLEIQELLDQEPKAARTKAPQTQTRIIYLLDNLGAFYPRLQKTNDGMKWTKGRNISLLSFSKGEMEGMTSLDHAVSRLVRKYHSYNGGVYTLQGPKAFVALLGHPHIYSASNPELHIEILAGTPVIQLVQAEDGFRLLCNIPEANPTEIVIAQESQLLYRVFTLNTLQQKLIALVQKNKVYPLQAQAELAQLIAKMAPIITVHSELEAQGDDLQHIHGSPRITLQILPNADGVQIELFCKPLEQEPPYCKAGTGQETLIAMHQEHKVVIKRDLKKEQENLILAQNLLYQATGLHDIKDKIILEALYDCLEVIQLAQEHDQSLRIEWPKGAKLKVKGKVDFPDLQASVRSVGAWFQVDGEVKVDKNTVLSLAELLEKTQAASGRFIELAPNEYFALSHELRKHLQALQAHQQPDHTIELSTFNTPLLSEMQQKGSKIKKDPVFATLEKRIEDAGQLKVKVPAELQASLRDYQREGYIWLSRLYAWGAGACLADDMGLGKTLQSIALLLSQGEQGASLIIAPASVVHNWKKEIQRFAPSLHCEVLYDKTPNREELLAQIKANEILVTTYGLLNRSRDLFKNNSWNIILLDEAHTIKNKDTKTSKAIMELKGKFRLALTGTPIQNHLGEIWNLFQFTNPRLLGSFEQFSNQFIIPIERDQDTLRQAHLKRMIQPFMLRRTKSEVLKELPSKTEIVHHVVLSPEERAFYETLRQKAIADIQEGSMTPIQTLAQITKLRQAACHPSLVEPTLNFNSSKVSEFLNLVQELREGDHRALVFSQFTSFLQLIAQELDKLHEPFLYLDGSTPIKERQKRVQTFQEGETPLFLISLKAGGTGLNLTAADYVIHLDPWWNPAIEDQASDRSHRFGQEKPVTIYRLIASQTIEEKIIQLHHSKKSLADSLLEGSNMAHKLTTEEIFRLLREDFVEENF